MYQKTTRDIEISIEPIYVEEHSVPEDDYYFWAYRVCIENSSTETVKLLSRTLRLADSLGRVCDFSGEGVIGEQPVLHPGESFIYESGTPLQAPSGMMLGRYDMQTETGDFFEAPLPAFSLDSPFELVSLN